MINLFVYGTLRSGHSRSDILENSKLIGTGVTRGTLYDLGPFPGTKFNKGSDVIGEVYEINQEVLNLLDMIEGNGFLFERKLVPVLVNKEYRDCWAYEFLHEVKEENVIKSGDYLKR